MNDKKELVMQIPEGQSIPGSGYPVPNPLAGKKAHPGSVGHEGRRVGDDQREKVDNVKYCRPLPLKGLCMFLSLSFYLFPSLNSIDMWSWSEFILQCSLIKR